MSIQEKNHIKTNDFKQLLKASFKSEDTEEWLDVHFTRPIGLAFALMWKKLGVPPNTITILSIFLGIGAAWMFYYTDLVHNVIGVMLLMLANFCDSTDGQLARLTNQKTLIGRILDGFSGDVWFFAIYFALCCRMMPQFMPATNMKWGIAIWAFAFVAGIMCHSPQASLSDYYRQIHLLFLKGKSGSELDTSKQQKNNYLKASQEKNAVMRWMSKAFFYNYANYCRSQEKRTPAFQKLKKELADRYGDLDNIPDDFRKEFLNASRPLMKYTNILTFNVRAICIYVTCLLNIPWVYFLIEIIPLTCLYVYMHRRHEHICISLYNKISNFS
jgi:hypothetical protein